MIFNVLFFFKEVIVDVGFKVEFELGEIEDFFFFDIMCGGVVLFDFDGDG